MVVWGCRGLNLTICTDRFWSSGGSPVTGVDGYKDECCGKIWSLDYTNNTPLLIPRMRVSIQPTRRWG